MGPVRQPRRLFISYTRADVAIATQIADGLRRAGHLVTIQATDFRPGNNFVIEMQKGLTTADHVIAVLSAAYEQSDFATAEWAAAFATDPTGTKRKLIGVRVEDYQPIGLLGPIVYVDIVGQDAEDADQLIVDAIETGQPATPHPPAAHQHTPIARPTAPVVPHFTGRAADLAVVGDAVANRRAVITGLGGIGKTSLTAAWVDEHQAGFELIVWLRAADRHHVAEAMSEAARAHGLVDDTADYATAEAALRRHLVENGPALVVLDDCVDALSAHDIIPDPSITVLVTSRHDQGWQPAGYTQHRLDPLTEDEATALLTAAAPHGGEGASLVAYVLGGLPVALAQAAAYIDHHAISFTDYLQRLATYAPAALDHPAAGTYEHTVMSVWSLALATIEETDAAAASLLRLLAFADPNDFPRGALSAGSETLPEPLRSCARDPFALDRAIAALLANSLCRAHGDGLSIHPVVQGVITHRAIPHDTEELLRAALAMMRASLPETHNPQDWSTWDRLRPHAMSFATEVARRAIFSKDLLPLVTDIASYGADRGAPHYAHFLYAQVMAYVSEHRDHPELATSDALFITEELASSFIELRAAHQAVPLLTYLVAFWDKHAREESDRPVATRVGLASALTDTGDHAAAIAHLEAAASIYEAQATPELSLGARLYGTWGRLLIRTGDPQAGRIQLERSLQLSDRAGDSAVSALTEVHLGNSYREEGRPNEATEHYERSLKICTSLRHRALEAEVVANLSGLAVEAGDLAKGLELAEAGLNALAEIPEGEFSVTAALLHHQRAMIRARMPDTPVTELVAELGEAFDIACSHLPPGHRHRLQIGAFLLTIADAVNDSEIRAIVLEDEPSLGTDPAATP